MPGAPGRGRLLQTDRIDHHVLEARAVDDVPLARRPLAEVDRTGVLAVAQHENDLARLVALAERLDRIRQGAPQRRQGVGHDRRRQRGQQFLAVARESRADRDLVAKRPQARHVFWQQPLEELDGGAAQQRQIALHAPGDVEQDDEPDRLRAVVELRERLGLAVVADLEVVAAERRHEPAVPVGHGDEDTDRVASRAEDLLCERRRTRCREGQPHQRQAREPERTANRAPPNREAATLADLHCAGSPARTQPSSNRACLIDLPSGVK